MEKVVIEKVNECFVRVHADPGIKMELSSHFEFEVPGARFMPAVRNKVWDGKIRLFNAMTGMIYTGLIPRIAKFCKVRNYDIELMDKNVWPLNKIPNDYGYTLAKEFDSAYEPRDYQNDAVVTAIRNNRGLLLSPTASGKSFMIYLLSRFHTEQDRRVLVVVPTTSLVHQMSTDFIEYNKGKNLDIHRIMAGVDKMSESPYTITTWQSIYKMPKKWFEQFDCIIVDEAHLAKAKSLTGIMEKAPNIVYRYGFTGTLDDSQTHKLVLEGLFGQVYQVTQTKKLIDDNTLADFNIKAVVLGYNDATRKINKNKTYQEEIDWIVRNEARNRFIRNLAWSLEGNTLVLFQFVEKHGKVLEPMLQKDGKNIHFIHGGVNAEDRESVRGIVDQKDRETVVLWFGNNEIELDINQKVFLTNGKVKLASDLTEDDDISDMWLESYINASENKNV